MEKMFVGQNPTARLRIDLARHCFKDSISYAERLNICDRLPVWMYSLPAIAVGFLGPCRDCQSTTKECIDLLIDWLLD